MVGAMVEGRRESQVAGNTGRLRAQDALGTGSRSLSRAGRQDGVVGVQARPEAGHGRFGRPR